MGLKLFVLTWKIDRSDQIKQFVTICGSDVYSKYVLKDEDKWDLGPKGVNYPSNLLQV